MLLFISKDLFFVGTIKTAAAQAGLETVVALNCDGKRIDSLDATVVKLSVVDLSGIGSQEVAEVAERLKNRFPQAKQVAYDQHVHVQKLELARAAGFDVVLSRGQLSSQFSQLLSGWIESN